MAITLTTSTGTEADVRRALERGGVIADREKPSVPATPEPKADAKSAPPPAAVEAKPDEDTKGAALDHGAEGEDDEPDTPEQTATPGDEPKAEGQARPVSRRQRQINSQIREAYQKGVNDTLAKQLEELRQPGAPKADGADSPPVSAPAPAKFPKYEDWAEKHPEGSYEDYIDARTEDTQRRVNAEHDAQVRDKAALDDFVKRHDEGRTAYTDYDQVLSQDLALSDVMVSVITSSPLSHHLMYRLGSDPEECARIAALPPADGYDAMRELIGEVKATLRAKPSASGADEGEPKPKPAPRPVTSAPAPPARVRPSVSAPASQTLSDMAKPGKPYKDWLAERNRQIAAGSGGSR